MYIFIDLLNILKQFFSFKTLDWFPRVLFIHTCVQYVSTISETENKMFIFNNIIITKQKHWKILTIKII